MVKIMHLAIMIVTLLIPIGSYAQFEVNGNGHAERKNIIEKIKDIDPAHIKNNRQLGFELNALAKQLNATLDYTVKQSKHQEQAIVPKLNQAQTAVLLKFIQPQYHLTNHTAVRALLDYLKQYAHVAHDEQIKQKINTLIKDKDAT